MYKFNLILHLKKCTKCGKIKDKNDFYTCKDNNKEGKLPICKACNSERRKKYYSNGFKDYAKTYYQSHKKDYKERYYRWCQANPDKVKSIRVKRKAKKKTLIIEKFSVLEIFERDHWICQICHKKVDKNKKYPNPFSSSLDHIIPLSKGGVHKRQNVQLSHLICNCKLRNSDNKQLRLY